MINRVLKTGLCILLGRLRTHLMKHYLPVGRNAHLQLFWRDIHARGIEFTISCLKPLAVSFFSADYAIAISFGVIQSPKPRVSVTLSLYNVSNGQLFVQFHRIHTPGEDFSPTKSRSSTCKGRSKSNYFLDSCKHSL